jgi:hypothetical protein
MIEGFNCALRQQVSRLAPGALSFSKMIKNHIGALKYFICQYNKVIIGLAESALGLWRYPKYGSISSKVFC